MTTRGSESCYVYLPRWLSHDDVPWQPPVSFWQVDKNLAARCRNCLEGFRPTASRLGRSLAYELWQCFDCRWGQDAPQEPQEQEALD